MIRCKPDVISTIECTDSITGPVVRAASNIFYSVCHHRAMLLKLIRQDRSRASRRQMYKAYRLIQALKTKYSLHGKSAMKYFYLELAITDGGDRAVGIVLASGVPAL
jgi:hypothetical protein